MNKILTSINTHAGSITSVCAIITAIIGLLVFQNNLEIKAANTRAEERKEIVALINSSFKASNLSIKASNISIMASIDKLAISIGNLDTRLTKVDTRLTKSIYDLDIRLTKSIDRLDDRITEIDKRSEVRTLESEKRMNARILDSEKRVNARLDRLENLFIKVMNPILDQTNNVSQEIDHQGFSIKPSAQDAKTSLGTAGKSLNEWLPVAVSLYE